MVFYTKQHRYFCGIDLHMKNMCVCIIDRDGNVCLHKNLPVTREAFLKAVDPYREDICVGVESTFSWYWLADLCHAEGIEFVLGHALYLKAIHGGKTKNDRIDSKKLATILRGGMFPSRGSARSSPGDPLRGPGHEPNRRRCGACLPIDRPDHRIPDCADDDLFARGGIMPP